MSKIAFLLYRKRRKRTSISSLDSVRSMSGVAAGEEFRRTVIELGNWLRCRREAARLTPPQLADKAGITLAEVHRLEFGDAPNGPELGTVYRYFAACGTPRLDIKAAGVAFGISLSPLVQALDDKGKSASATPHSTSPIEMASHHDNRTASRRTDRNVRRTRNS